MEYSIKRCVGVKKNDLRMNKNITSDQPYKKMENSIISHIFYEAFPLSLQFVSGLILLILLCCVERDILVRVLY